MTSSYGLLLINIHQISADTERLLKDFSRVIVDLDEFWERESERVRERERSIQLAHLADNNETVSLICDVHKPWNMFILNSEFSIQSF